MEPKHILDSVSFYKHVLHLPFNIVSCLISGKSSGGLKRCARCQVTYYCSKECQKEHWKKGNHKAVCEEGVLAEPGRFPGYQMTFMNVSTITKAKSCLVWWRNKGILCITEPTKSQKICC